MRLGAFVLVLATSYAHAQPAPGAHPDYPEVAGPAFPAPGLTLHGHARTFAAEGAAALLNCDVFQRNGEAIDQCRVMDEDCTGMRG